MLRAPACLEALQRKVKNPYFIDDFAAVWFFFAKGVSICFDNLEPKADINLKAVCGRA
jgi:hypothetical protein